MEQFYAGMDSISEGKKNEKEIYFTLEVALSASSDEVVVYAAIPNKHLSLFEKQILAYYHDAKIREASDDYNIFNNEGESAGAYASLKERVVMPLKTYDNIDHDPMNTILNVFSKLKTQGEGAAIQLVVAPAGDKYVNEFHLILDDVKEGMSVKHAADNFYKFHQAFLQAGKEIIFGVKKPEEKKDSNMKGRRAVDEGAVEKIGNKVKSNIMKANIRTIASAETKERAEAILDAADGLMVARGDLGFSIPMAELPFVQKELIALALKKAKPVITGAHLVSFLTQRIRPMYMNGTVKTPNP